MYLAVHATIGAIIGKYAPNPMLAFWIGFLGHFLTDMVPHGDSVAYKKYKQGVHKKKATAIAVADIALAIIISIILLRIGDFQSLQTATWAILGSVLPDIIIGIHIAFDAKRAKFEGIYKSRFAHKLLDKFHNLHFFMHDFIVNRHKDWSRQRHGALFQGILWGLAVWLVKWR